MIHVVTGPPCSGKSTYVNDHRNEASVVVDLDRLCSALGYPAGHIEWGDNHPAADAAHRARFAVINAALTGKLNAETWIIDSSPTRAMRSQYRRAGARWHEVDPGLDTCMARATADERPPGTLEQIRTWYAHTKAGLDVFE